MANEERSDGGGKKRRDGVFILQTSNERYARSIAYMTLTPSSTAVLVGSRQLSMCLVGIDRLRTYIGFFSPLRGERRTAWTAQPPLNTFRVMRPTRPHTRCPRFIISLDKVKMINITGNDDVIRTCFAKELAEKRRSISL